MVVFEPRRYGLVGRPSYDQIVDYLTLAKLKTPDTFIDRTAKWVRESPQIQNLLDTDGQFGHKEAENVFNKQMELQELHAREHNKLHKQRKLQAI